MKSLSRQMPVVLLLLAVGCEKAPGTSLSQTQSVEEAADPDILPISVVAIDQQNTVAISDEVFLSVMADRRFGAASNANRDGSIEFAALANDSRALGITGWKESGVSLEGKRVIVVHNARKADGERMQATSFSVLNGDLEATADSALVNVRLHLVGQPELDCSRRYRGCIPVMAEDMRPHAFSNWNPGGLGLPPSVRVDAETSGRPVNHLARSIELWNLPNPDVAEILWPPLPDEVDGYIGNRFVCAAPYENESATECDTMALAVDPPLESGLTMTPLSTKVALVAEADFEAARLKGEFDQRDFKPENVALAAELVTTLNNSNTRGIRAKRSSKEALEAETLVVAKTPRVSPEGVIEAERYFVVPGPLVINGNVLGVEVGIATFGPPLFSMGVCGPVMFPQLEYPREESFPAGTYNKHQGGYGSDRLQTGRARTTMRWPVNVDGLREVEVLACSLFEPPRPPPREGDGPVFRQEYCNGIDDNGNGKIDEGACSLASCTTCVPVPDCGPRRCLSVPDGCGALLECPCP